MLNYDSILIRFGELSTKGKNKKDFVVQLYKNVKTALLIECRKLESAINLIPFGKKITVENIVRNIIYLGLTKRIDFLDKDVKEEK